jgi:hypothetical protein
MIDKEPFYSESRGSHGDDIDGATAGAGHVLEIFVFGSPPVIESFHHGISASALRF